MAKSTRKKSKSELIEAVKGLKGLSCPQEKNVLVELVLHLSGEAVFHDETAEEEAARLKAEAEAKEKAEAEKSE